MCEPITIATTVAILGTAYAAYEQDQTIDAQNDLNREAAKEGSKLANAAFINQTGLARRREAEENSAVSQELVENAKKAAQARATARVSAGEAGVAGLSVDALVNDFYRQEGNYADSVVQNQEFSADQIQAEMSGFRSQAQDRSLALRRPGINRPSYLAAGLTASGQAVQGYERYRYSNTNG